MKVFRPVRFLGQSDWCSGHLFCRHLRLILFADLVLIIHFSIVFFVVFGLVALPIGYLRNYCWTQNAKFRVAHMLLMGFITLEAGLGITCPLTTIENALRQIEYQKSFVAYWVSRFIYWDLPTYSFVILYFSCFIWSLVFWKLHPPRSLNKKRIDTNGHPADSWTVSSSLWAP